jgi:hypothetical protein
MMSVEQSVEWELAREPKVLGKKKNAPAPQIPLDLTLNQTQAVAVGTQWLTTWPTARTNIVYIFKKQLAER